MGRWVRRLFGGEVAPSAEAEAAHRREVEKLGALGREAERVHRDIDRFSETISRALRGFP